MKLRGADEECGRENDLGRGQFSSTCHFRMIWSTSDGPCDLMVSVPVMNLPVLWERGAPITTHISQLEHFLAPGADPVV